ncbi:MAG: 16S rRNA (cytosine(1402)-N(4))-methyltransferase RsmH [Anaerolineae bacterium]
MENKTATTGHIPVLFDEVMEWLQPAPGKHYIDATLGLGGHAEGILERSGPDGRLLGIDRDPQALARAQSKLARFGNRIVIRNASFADLQTVAEEAGFAQVDGIMFDLGVSSLQLDEAERGFSFRENGPLDMRMGPDAPQSAADIVNTWPEQDLANVIYEYGEERHSRRIARAICAARPFCDTASLAAVVARAAGPAGKIHPATRTFQALRIVVNDELGALQRALPQAVTCLLPYGRLVVIAFHSLEDRIVKQFIKGEVRNCICPPEMPLCTCGHRATLQLGTRKPIMASETEVARNPRSRSARLRAATRLGGTV